MLQKNTFSLLPPTLLFSLGLVWGAGYAIARLVMTSGVHPLGYTFWQAIGPAIILILICLISKQPLKLKPRYILFYFICGLVGIAIPNTNMYFAAEHLPAGLLALVINTVPVMIYPMALLSGQEKFHWLRFLGVIAAVTGILLLVLPKANLTSISQPYWVLFALLTPFCFALFATYINPRRPKDSTPLSLAAGMMACAALLLSPIIFNTHNYHPLTWPISFIDSMIILQMFLASLGYVLFFWLLKIAGSVYYSMVDGVVAITGLVWGMILFGEQFNAWEGSAALLILAALAVMTWQQKNTQGKY
jgi:drug/metabolite transporter (DMT)-like permease